MTDDQGRRDLALSAARVVAREARARSRIEAATARSEHRAAAREQAARDREAAREARRAGEIARAAARSEARAAEDRPKRRASGALSRTGEVGQVRDTRHYQVIVDTRRIRELARRGASIPALAATFGLTEQALETLLATETETAGQAL